MSFAPAIWWSKDANITKSNHPWPCPNYCGSLWGVYDPNRKQHHSLCKYSEPNVVTKPITPSK